MSTALATTDTKTLRTLITSEAVQSQLAIALPRYYTPDQFTLIVRTAINRNPKLGECTQASFLASMLVAAQMGILPNGRDGHLIPRWNSKLGGMECTFLPDYKGIVGLIRRNDSVADIYAVCVHKNDRFKITQGLHRDIIHEPDYTQDRGEIIGVYAVILFKTGLSTWEFLSRSEVEGIRARSDSWKAHLAKGYDTPWKTDEGEMFKKTSLKRVSKLADLSPETVERLMNDPDMMIEVPTPVKEIKSATIPTQALADTTKATGTAAAPVEEQQEEDAGYTSSPVEETPAEPAAEAKAPAEKKATATVVEPAAEAKPPAKKLVKAPKPDPAAPAERPQETEIKARCERDGLKVEAMITVCAKEKWCKADDKLSDLEENVLNSILEYWAEFVPDVKAIMEGGAQ